VHPFRYAAERAEVRGGGTAEEALQVRQYKTVRTEFAAVGAFAAVMRFRVAPERHRKLDHGAVGMRAVGCGRPAPRRLSLADEAVVLLAARGGAVRAQVESLPSGVTTA
jgi:hypothetical protein